MSNKFVIRNKESQKYLTITKHSGYLSEMWVSDVFHAKTFLTVENAKNFHSYVYAPKNTLEIIKVKIDLELVE